MHDLGSVTFYLVMSIESNRDEEMIDFEQHSYIRVIFAQFRTEVSRPLASPMAMKLDKRKPNLEASYPPRSQSMIGSTMYVMTATEPDIADAIVVLSRYNHSLSNAHQLSSMCFSTTRAHGTGDSALDEHSK